MIPKDILEKVLANAQETASHSWEHSTVFEALLEYRNPEYTIFHGDALPNGKVPRLKLEEVDALRYVLPHIRTDSDTLSEGNGSSTDPFSLLIPTHLLSASPSFPPETQTTYSTALTQQLTTLLTHTPRFPNGAISHRSAYASLWSDAIYMFPPNLAYHAVLNQDMALAKETARQCLLYSDVLRTKSGLWRHIVNAPGTFDVKTDDGAWSTANAWVVAGLARVLATFAQCNSMQDDEQMGLLRDLLKDTLDAVIRMDTHSSLLLRNYLDDEEAFPDVAGTALMAATGFRFALLTCSYDRGDGDTGDSVGPYYAAWAKEKLQAVVRHVDPQTGIAHPVVDSLKEKREMAVGEVNPEAQAFVVLAWAAWRDWMAAVGESREGAV